MVAPIDLLRSRFFYDGLDPPYFAKERGNGRCSGGRREAERAEMLPCAGKIPTLYCIGNVLPGRPFPGVHTYRLATTVFHYILYTLHYYCSPPCVIASTSELDSAYCRTLRINSAVLAAQL